jgi:hypothetical protein
MLAAAAILPPLTLCPGMVISHSVKVKPLNYSFTATDEIRTPILTVRGKHITVDFSGATLRGSDENSPPDRRSGLALKVEGEDITLRNLKIRGYRLAILAHHCKRLHLTNCDWSYNWKQHLKSTSAKEDEADWMSFHHNENDEWIYGTKDEPGYGAGGVYLADCEKFEVDHCTDTGSQCGLMLNRCTEGLVWSNNFSFLSAIGIGLYRSSGNKVMHNAIDYCVRGYSHGVYSRGQDSAAILVYEQSNRNVFAYNCATHGGDGFFLWAGQSTMDSGQGGCNDNLVVSNDFSHSPANGIEATFSRNTFVNNRLVECWHGVWGGYSYDSKWLGNHFLLDGEAISIEHGQNNEIIANDFNPCDSDIRLWADPIADKSWGYGLHRDCESHDYKISENLLGETVAEPLLLRNTANLHVLNNNFFDSRAPIKRDPSVRNLVFRGNILSYCGTAGLSPDEVAGNTISGTFGHPLAPTMQRNGNTILENDPSLRGVPNAVFHVNWSYRRDAGRAGTGGAEMWARVQKLDKIAGQFEPKPIAPATEDARRFHAPSASLGRRYIIVDEWGPYDFKRPLLLPGKRSGNVQQFELLGPRGRWKLVDVKGGNAVTESGEAPGRLEVNLGHGELKGLRLTLEFKGERLVTEFGQEVPLGIPYRFSFSGS